MVALIVNVVPPGTVKSPLIMISAGELAVPFAVKDVTVVPLFVGRPPPPDKV